ILTMLEMGKIPIYSKGRNDSHPLIIAGGPGSLNPEPLAGFIDAFIIGDGEDVLVEILEASKISKLNKESREESLKRLSKIEGIYIPEFYNVPENFSKPVPVNFEFSEKINKRISDFDSKYYPVNFPVPYSSSIHDRAVIEIRRGCGRMCRFCQSCFANLPVREREPEKVIELTEETLHNTGYDEYSLLSLSSSDYRNIEPLVCELNRRHASSGASISLPSQRADAFSLDLANEVQSVRKSTLTFAPEAGSQRLRDVINKNLNEDQIMNAVMSAYKSGWSSVKLYFMIGLPSETNEDIDEIFNLLKRIKDRSRDLKNELEIKKHLDITCTVSIFVPKPFTPFQWCAQDRLEIINEKIKYLRDKVKFIKGVKLNYHDSFLCQLEAVFSRGDRKLGILIERVWKKGSYLDAWNEHFNKKIWYEAAEELNINFHDYSSKKINLDSELPWDIINIGIEKKWLIEEYNKSIQSQVSVPCDERCAQCGVCDTFGKKTQIIEKNSFSGSEKITPEKQNTEIYKYRIKIQKTDDFKYISHLDWQRLLYRAFRKANINLDFTKGFNPQPKISIGLALPIFAQSICEFVDIEIKENMQENILLEKMNEVLPDNSKVLRVVKISKDEQSVDRTVCWAQYTASPVDLSETKNIDMEYIVKNAIARDNIFIEKQKHKGLKKLIDIRPSIYSINVKKEESFYNLEFVLKTGQGESPILCDEKMSKPGSLRADEFLKFLTPDIKWSIKREKLFDCNFKELV
ncbi:MAG: TIGR03960 family B12-binding radical SAM protein, partial [Candidatus Gastranaerophilales bacterium]|nr:TIGR03960 family B12-binding radical SAM protein [Candidatus Gastranaerophilales bacterium]